MHQSVEFQILKLKRRSDSESPSLDPENLLVHRANISHSPVKGLLKHCLATNSELVILQTFVSQFKPMFVEFRIESAEISDHFSVLI